MRALRTPNLDADSNREIEKYGREIADGAAAAVQEVSDGLGTAAVEDIGTSGSAVPMLDGVNTWSGAQQFVGGVKFPATQVPSADVNTLDDYEEGTFTPELQFNGATTGITYSQRFARHTKIGRVVVVEVFIALLSKGSATGPAKIVTLPFTAGSLGDNFGGRGGSIIDCNDLSSVTAPYAAIGSDTTGTVIDLRQVSSGTRSDLSNTNFTNSSALRFTLVYSV